MHLRSPNLWRKTWLAGGLLLRFVFPQLVARSLLCATRARAGSALAAMASPDWGGAAGEAEEEARRTSTTGQSDGTVDDFVRLGSAAAADSEPRREVPPGREGAEAEDPWSRQDPWSADPWDQGQWQWGDWQRSWQWEADWWTREPRGKDFC
jgi:hypothetical protein